MNKICAIFIFWKFTMVMARPHCDRSSCSSFFGVKFTFARALFQLAYQYALALMVQTDVATVGSSDLIQHVRMLSRRLYSQAFTSVFRH